MPKDKELQDHERAHSGKPGSSVRHGADATGKVHNPLDYQVGLNQTSARKNLPRGYDVESGNVENQSLAPLPKVRVR